MKLKIFTLPSCSQCPAAKKVAEAIAKQRKDIILEVLDLSDANNMTAALMMQIASTPSFTINDTPIFIGELPTIDELNEKIDEYKQRMKL
ncbi:MAG: thioredoxin family protein [Candidatus Bathyarchaeota archaeon]